MLDLMAITATRQTIQLSSAYFVPDELTVKALVDAAKRGVSVQIIMPGTAIDAEVVRSASRELWGRPAARRRQNRRVPADDVPRPRRWSSTT